MKLPNDIERLYPFPDIYFFILLLWQMQVPLCARRNDERWVGSLLQW